MGANFTRAKIWKESIMLMTGLCLKLQISLNWGNQKREVLLCYLTIFGPFGKLEMSFALKVGGFLLCLYLKGLEFWNANAEDSQISSPSVANQNRN